MTRPFLTARWENLVIVTYAVPRELLMARLPRGLELDEWEGKAHASLVAFDFRGCRVKGVAVPGLVNFPEINLRFYVREKVSGRRGVVFVREFVPSRVISLVARAVYNEPYERAEMRSGVTVAAGGIRVEHEMRTGRGGLSMVGEGRGPRITPGGGSAEHFFKEHSWGYGVDRRGGTLVYEVRHPVWEVWQGATAHVRGDVGAIYGKGWEVLNGATPAGVVVAAGSGVEVMGCVRAGW